MTRYVGLSAIWHSASPNNTGQVVHNHISLQLTSMIMENTVRLVWNQEVMAGYEKGVVDFP